MLLWKTIPVMFLLGGLVNGQTEEPDNDLEVYDIQSTADLVRLEEQGFGVAYDPMYGNEEDQSDKVIMTAMDTAVIVMYSLIIFIGLIANSVVFFVIFAGHEIGESVFIHGQLKHGQLAMVH